ncbi:MAG: arsenosugar biosynthesis radical SAM protein ArsS [Methylophaga sp.]
MHNTLSKLEQSDFPLIRRQHLTTLQANLGYMCNQTCVHCHVNAGPNRKEQMSEANLEMLVQVLEKAQIKVLDLTGGAPEMHPAFKQLVEQATALGVKVIDRCNLTILAEPGYEDMASFLASHRVEVVASLPCYSVANVDRQRGKGVFGQSIEGLKQLNALGYGKPDSGLVLNLVYNPQGASLPPPQQQLEQDYKRELKQHFDIEFNALYTITNMPIKRFGSMLISKGTFDDYLRLLKDSYQEENLEQLMCRELISVDWQGYLYDCDFNQQLGLPLGNAGHRHLSELLNTGFDGEKINTADHCYGCTAGQGSSCGGAL